MSRDEPSFQLNLPLRLYTAICFLFLFSSTLRAADAPIGDFQAQTDIGKVQPSGSAEYDKTTKQYTVKSSGENIWAAHDDFHFLYSKLSGDLTLTADIAFVGEGKNAHRKAGCMIRLGLEPDAPYVDVMVDGNGMIALQYRPAKGELTKDIKSKVKSPATVRIQRQGDTINVSVAPKPEKPDKPQAFEPTGEIKIDLKDPVYAGLAVSAHDAATTETATYTNVTLGK